jgi:hypothetical protein
MNEEAGHLSEGEEESLAFPHSSQKLHAFYSCCGGAAAAAAAAEASAAARIDAK